MDCNCEDCKFFHTCTMRRVIAKHETFTNETCKYCLEDTGDLIKSPCDCTGTLGFVHGECLITEGKTACSVCSKLYYTKSERSRKRRSAGNRHNEIAILGFQTLIGAFQNGIVET